MLRHAGENPQVMERKRAEQTQVERLNAKDSTKMFIKVRCMPFLCVLCDALV
jgi:hypothetical protein